MPRHFIDQTNLRIVDVRSEAQSPDGHIPGAIRFDVTKLVRNRVAGSEEHKNVGLCIPTAQEITQIIGSHGISPEDFVVAYDDDTGANAARLLWTLDLIGHRKYAMLDGGFAAWEDAELSIAQTITEAEPVLYPTQPFNESISDIHAVHQASMHSEITIVDTRSPKEFVGSDSRARKAGHIPNAINFDWVQSLDMFEGGKLKSTKSTLAHLHGLGIHPSQKIILYCQTNRRSSHAFVIFKWLGFTDVSTYPGAWEQWGNTDWTPVETQQSF